MEPPTMTPELEALSDDAKMILAAHFSWGGKARLTFQTPWNITARAAAALAEAVKADALTLEVGVEGLYAHTYRAAIEVESLGPWMRKHSAKAKGFIVMLPDRERLERPPASWPVPAGFKRHPK
jgi:hypothetical protein